MQWARELSYVYKSPANRSSSPVGAHSRKTKLRFDETAERHYGIVCLSSTPRLHQPNTNAHCHAIVRTLPVFTRNEMICWPLNISTAQVQLHWRDLPKPIGWWHKEEDSRMGTMFANRVQMRTCQSMGLSRDYAAYVVDWITVWERAVDVRPTSRLNVPKWRSQPSWI